jgi:hypothetical protein
MMIADEMFKNQVKLLLFFKSQIKSSFKNRI